MIDGTLHIEVFDSVWDAIEPTKADAANMKARAGVMIAFRQTVESWRTTQAKAAKRLGVTQLRLNDLLKGRIAQCNLEELINPATLAGWSASIEMYRVTS